MSKTGYYLGVICSDANTMKNPYLMKNTEPIWADSYEQAKEEFLKGVFINKAKINDVVAVLAVVGQVS